MSSRTEFGRFGFEVGVCGSFAARAIARSSWIPGVALLALASSSIAQTAVVETPHMVVASGSMLESPATDDCITSAERADVERKVNAWYASMGGASSFATFASSQPYTFFPMGGRLYRDVFTYKFVDLDPTAGVLDWNCTDRTSNAHLGNDTLISAFEEQSIGMPVFAALDGVVMATNDGYPDMNIVCATSPANYVVIDHGGGRATYYWQLRAGSVSVNVGQVVKAGQQIAQVGSSGCSYWPHLHFEEQQNGNVVEPYTGPCHPGMSGWAQQTPIDYSLYVDGFGISESEPQLIGTGTYLPRAGQLAVTSQWLWFWVYIKNLPANSTYRTVLVRPDSTIADDSGTQPFGLTAANRWCWSYWGLWPAPTQQALGTWRVRVFLNNVLQVDSPLEVVPVLVPGFNRPPLPITVAFSPAYPTPSDVVACEITTNVALDDLDFDALRYHYVWRANGVVVRDVISSGQADYLARNSWNSGDALTCDVTPNDGHVDGTTATARFFVAQPYCTAGTTSHGCVPAISGIGAPSATAASGFAINVSTVEGNKQGLIFYGIDNTAFVPAPWGPSSSWFCVKQPTQRSGALSSGGTTNACNGALAIDWNAFVAATPNALGEPFAVGQHVFAQGWFRDPASPKTTALSPGLEFTVGP